MPAATAAATGTPNTTLANSAAKAAAKDNANTSRRATGDAAKILAAEKELGAVEGLIKKLNPSATVIRTSHGNVDVKKILDTKKY